MQKIELFGVDHWGNKFDLFESTALVVIVHPKSRLEIIGTAFFILSDGMFLTAAHVVRESLHHQNIALIHKVENEDDIVLRRVVHTLPHPMLDVAFGKVEPLVDEATKKQKRCRTVTLADVPPLIGSPIGCFGYPQSFFTGANSQNELETLLLERHASRGFLEEHFRHGRDSVMQPGECYQTSLNTMGGSSGGPVFDESGKAFALVSTGFDGNLTYISPILSIVSIPFLPVHLPDGSVKRMSVLEYAKKY